MNQLDLARQCAVVTDGARGIGLAISRRLLQSGASGCIWDCDVRALDEATGIFAPFGKVHAVEMDVTSEPSVLASVEATVGHLGFISLLMNNAGIAGNNARTWKLDVTGVFLCCRAVVPLEDSDAPVRQGR